MILGLNAKACKETCIIFCISPFCQFHHQEFRYMWNLLIDGRGGFHRNTKPPERLHGSFHAPITRILEHNFQHAEEFAKYVTELYRGMGPISEKIFSHNFHFNANEKGKFNFMRQLKFSTLDKAFVRRFILSLHYTFFCSTTFQFKRVILSAVKMSSPFVNSHPTFLLKWHLWKALNIWCKKLTTLQKQFFFTSSQKGQKSTAFFVLVWYTPKYITKVGLKKKHNNIVTN